MPYAIEIAVFVAGASIMILEIVGSRFLIPYVGASIIVWTSLIGMILASMSAGYFWGGRYADRSPSRSRFALLLTAAGGAILVPVVFKPWLFGVVFGIPDIRLRAMAAAFLLFAPATFLLGAISPYAVKLRLSDPAATGKTVGNLSAIATAGSICGTFAAGFFLIPTLGLTTILFLLGIALSASSLLVTGKPKRGLGALGVFFVVGSIAFSVASRAPLHIQEFNSAYNRIWVLEQEGILSKRHLIANPYGIQSSMFVDDPTALASPYTEYYDLATAAHPNIRRALMIGGGAYSYPKYFLKTHPEATLDVVELDPAMTEVAKSHFGFASDPRLNIVHADGRTWIEQAPPKTYDAIFVDVFETCLPPHYLVTEEAIRRMRDILTENGAVVMNVPGILEGERSEYLGSVYATFKAAFPSVRFFPVQYPKDGREFQNVMLLALAQGPEDRVSDDPAAQKLFDGRWTKPIAGAGALTDDHAPIEYRIECPIFKSIAEMIAQT